MCSQRSPQINFINYICDKCDKGRQSIEKRNLCVFEVGVGGVAGTKYKDFPEEVMYFKARYEGW